MHFRLIFVQNVLLGGGWGGGETSFKLLTPLELRVSRTSVELRVFNITVELLVLKTKVE